jgi:hypothetical protein
MGFLPCIPKSILRRKSKEGLENFFLKNNPKKGLIRLKLVVG